MRREVVLVVSPGTLTDAGYLDAREPALLVAIAPAVDALGGRPGVYSARYAGEPSDEAYRSAQIWRQVMGRMIQHRRPHE